MGHGGCAWAIDVGTGTGAMNMPSMEREELRSQLHELTA